MTLTRGRSELTLITTINPGPVSWGDVEFDGDALFAHLRGRVSGRIVLAHGKRLTWGDQTWTLRREASVQFERSAKGVRMVNLEPEAVEVETGGTVLSVGPQVHAGGAV